MKNFTSFIHMLVSESWQRIGHLRNCAFLSTTTEIMLPGRRWWHKGRLWTIAGGGVGRSWNKIAWILDTGCRPPTPYLYTKGRGNYTPLFPSGIGEIYCQTISNLGRSCGDVNSPYKRKCWTNSGGPLVNSLLWNCGPEGAENMLLLAFLLLTAFLLLL